MTAGGAWPGAGRPKGGANRLNDEARRAALAGGLSPLDFLLGVMRDEAQPFERRLDAAKASAPYLHARLQAVSLAGPGGGPIEVQSAVLDASSLFLMNLVSEHGGEGGIRTPDTVARMPHFECGAFNHSATSPQPDQAFDSQIVVVRRQ